MILKCLYFISFRVVKFIVIILCLYFWLSRFISNIILKGMRQILSKNPRDIENNHIYLHLKLNASLKKKENSRKSDTPSKIFTNLH